MQVSGENSLVLRAYKENTEVESITIAVKVTNKGGATGSHVIELKIDGIVKEVREITLEPGVSQIITFTLEEVKAGEHKVEVGGVSGSISVVAPPPPPPPPPTPPVPSKTPVIAGIIAGVVAVVGLFIFFWVKRRRRRAH